MQSNNDVEKNVLSLFSKCMILMEEKDKRKIIDEFVLWLSSPDVNKIYDALSLLCQSFTSIKYTQKKVIKITV